MSEQQGRAGIGLWFALAYVGAMYAWYYYAWGRQFLDYLTTKFSP